MFSRGKKRGNSFDYFGRNAADEFDRLDCGWVSCGCSFKVVVGWWGWVVFAVGRVPMLTVSSGMGRWVSWVVGSDYRSWFDDLRYALI